MAAISQAGAACGPFLTADKRREGVRSNAHERASPWAGDSHAVQLLSREAHRGCRPTSLERVQRALNPRLVLQGVLLTMYDRRNNLCDLVAADVRGHFGDKVYDTVIPRNVRISEAPSHGKPVLLYDFRSAGAQAYIHLASEVLRREQALGA